MPLTADQLAQTLGVKPASVLRWARRGEIPCHRVGSRVWFDLDEVQAATLRAAKVRQMVAVSPGAGQLDPRFLEIINGRQPRRAGRTSAGTKKARRPA